MASVVTAPPSRPPAICSTWAAAVLAGAAALFLLRLGDRAVVSEEVRWAEVAREMRATGDYFHPAINGQSYFDKPLGSYWLILAASHLTGGVNETAARLPPAFAGWVGVLLVIALGRRLYDSRTGVLAGAVLATSLGFVQYSRRATADVETVTGVLAAVWWADRHRDRGGGPWVIGLWLIMSATSLTKGLLGFVLPCAVLLCHGLRTAPVARLHSPAVPDVWAAVAARNSWLFNRWTLAGVPLAVAVYLLPFYLSARETGASDGLDMVWRENVRRFAAPHNHTGPVYLYVGVVFVIAAPWAAFLPAALIPPVLRDGDRRAGLLARSYFWAVFAFFTLAASRRSYYLLPILPPAALLIARLLITSPEHLRRSARALRAAGWVGFGAVVTVAGVAVLLPHESVLPAPYDRLPELPGRLPFGLGWAAGLVALGWAAWAARGRLPAVSAAVTAAGVGYTVWVALPALDGVRTRPGFVAEVRSRTDSDPGKLALYHARDAVFDLGRTAPDYPSTDGLTAALHLGEVRWVIVRRRYLAGAGLPARVVSEEVVHPWEGPDQVGDKLVLLEVETKSDR